MRTLPIAFVLATILASTSANAATATTSPGKNSAYASTNDVATLGDSLTPGPLLTVTIAKGKPKRVLEVAATLHYFTPSPGLPVLSVTVNGVAIEPTAGAISSIAQSCSAYCTLSGTWWLDLDAAEVAAPGTVLGEALTVVLHGFDGGPGGQSYAATLSARLEKK